MKRPRHSTIIEKLVDLGVNINFITDGDIAGGLTVIGDNPKNDIYYINKSTIKDKGFVFT